jgi:hypothetical protein
MMRVLGATSVLRMRKLSGVHSGIKEPWALALVLAGRYGKRSMKHYAM